MTGHELPFVAPGGDATPIWPVSEKAFARWVGQQPPAVAEWLRRQRFQPKPGRVQTVPGKAGALAGVVVGIAEPATLWNFAGLTLGLPAGRYRIDAGRGFDAAPATTAALGWAFGAYRFTRYRKPPEGEGGALLEWPAKADRAYVLRAARGAAIMRDLVNTPAGDLGPADLAEAALRVAADAGAEAEAIVGEDLLARGYPMVHAVGRAGRQEPRLIDLRWGNGSGPRVTLVGKGVCFDTGGLDLKTADGMLLMKKDMAGAAICLGLLHMLADAKFDIRLRVLLPMVENAVSSDAYHPGDVLSSRKGLTVEIGNTDAEGRLILADALTEADQERPDLLVDFSTLTGAARVALGPDLPALYANDDGVASDLMAIGAEEADPSWRMPLWAPYAEMLDSKIADLNNVAHSAFAGSITAALFLKRFVERSPAWVHLDLYAWNPKARPGRPEGAEAQTMRAVYRLIERRYGSKKRSKP